MDTFFDYLTRPFFGPWLTQLPIKNRLILQLFFPITAGSLLLFSVIFLLIYLFHPFGLGDYKEMTCMYNRPFQRTERSILKTFQSSYIFFWMIHTPLMIHLFS